MLQTGEKQTLPAAIRPNNALLVRIQQQSAPQSTTYEALGIPTVYSL